MRNQKPGFFIVVVVLTASAVGFQLPARTQTGPAERRVAAPGTSDNQVIPGHDYAGSRFGGPETGTNAYMDATIRAVGHIKKWGLKADPDEFGKAPVKFNRGQSGRGTSITWQKYVSPSGDLSFHYPAGWKAERSEQAIIVTNPQTDEQLTLWHMPYDRSKSPRELVEGMVALLRKNYPDMKASNWVPNAKSPDLATTFSLAYTDTRTPYRGDGLALKEPENNRATWFAFTGPSAGYADADARYILMAFALSLSPGRNSKPPAPAADQSSPLKTGAPRAPADPTSAEPKTSGATPLNGVYRRFAIVRAGSGAMEAKAYVFSGDGRFYAGWPGTESLDPFDLNHHPGASPADYGTYSITSSRIVFQQADGTARDSQFRTEPGKNLTSVDIGDSHWYKVVPWKGRTVEGVYKSSSNDFGFRNREDAFPDFARGSGMSLSLHGDGTFKLVETKWVVREWRENSIKGTYNIVGTTLTLIVSDGTRRTCDLYVLEESALDRSPGIFFINGRPWMTD